MRAAFYVLIFALTFFGSIRMAAISHGEDPPAVKPVVFDSEFLQCVQMCLDHYKPGTFPCAFWCQVMTRPEPCPDFFDGCQP